VIALVVTISRGAAQTRLLMRQALGALRRFRNSAPLTLAVLATNWKWIGPALDRLHERGGWAATLFGAAVFLWAAAFVLRLLGHFHRLLRGLAVLGLLAVTLGLLAGAGLLPAHDPKKPFGLDWRTWIVLTAVLVIGSALAEGAIVHAIGEEPASGWRRPLARAVRPFRHHRTWFVTEVASRVGWGFAVVGAALILASAVAAQVEKRSAGRAVDSSRPTPQTPAIDLQTIKDDQRLAELFAPVLAFTANERWPPMAADVFVDERAVMLGPEGKTKKSFSSLPRQCREEPLHRPCFTLTCEPEGSCAQPRIRRSGRFAEAAVYARVVRLTPANAAIFAVPNPFNEEELSALVQYWVFYAYDEWTAPIVVGRLRQRHEGDWEAITVGLGKAPLFVAYSAHCAGTWARWNQIEAESASSGPPNWQVGEPEDKALAVHPLVAVGEGSHANYVRVSDRRSSDWSSCRDIPSEAVDALTYASNIRDITGDAWRIYPERVEVVTERDPPMTFPGRWGLSDVTTLESARVRTLHSGPGPRTPSLQRLWTDPLTTIFKGPPRWREIER
jgi:hypothetical protein